MCARRPCTRETSRDPSSDLSSRNPRWGKTFRVQRASELATTHMTHGPELATAHAPRGPKLFTLHIYTTARSQHRQPVIPTPGRQDIVVAGRRVIPLRTPAASGASGARVACRARGFISGVRKGRRARHGRRSRRLRSPLGRSATTLEQQRVVPIFTGSPCVPVPTRDNAGMYISLECTV